jgi:hypothetical protein
MEATVNTFAKFDLELINTFVQAQRPHQDNQPDEFGIWLDGHAQYPYEKAKFVRISKDFFNELGFGSSWPLPIDEKQGYALFSVHGVHYEEPDSEPYETALMFYYDKDYSKWMSVEVSHPYRGMTFVDTPIKKK